MYSTDVLLDSNPGAQIAGGIKTRQWTSYVRWEGFKNLLAGQ